MEDYEEHLDQIEEDAYERKYAKRMVEACLTGIIDELARHHRITPIEALKKHAETIKKIALTVQPLTNGDLLAKKRGIDLSYSIDDLSYRFQDQVPPREAKELKWIEETLANPESTDLQVDEASAVEQAIDDVTKIGTETDSPELDELYASGQEAAKASIR
ncbi:hypothetical protein [Desulfoluna sp.]|uniref:hypothetical protein n=1 Tax=Desulfoluna sp. TaxID=2045199 RepID=UPI0026100049|nr:hypothetical protein [Desulfoluna sp.]